MSILSAVKDRFRQEFGRKDGFLARLNDPNDRQMVKAKRVGTLVGAGAVGGGVLGGATGGLMAAHAISKVPVQSIDVPFQAPKLTEIEIGKIPQDSYTAVTGWSVGVGMEHQRPGADLGVPSVPVNRFQPVYDGNRQPTMLDAHKTFSGRGTPSVQWEPKKIIDHKMLGHNRLIVPHTESVYDHTETWSEPVSYTTYTSETQSRQDCVSQYNSDGSTSQDCHTVTETVQVPHQETRMEQRSREVYRDELRGWFQKYSPDIREDVVGGYQYPKVTFDHGINVAGYVTKGILIGAALGAVAGGIAGAIEDRHFHLPGWKPLPGDTPVPDPLPGPPPSPGPNPGHPGSSGPVPPTPVPGPVLPPAQVGDFGKFVTHAHEGRRHAHDGGDRWHCHGDPKLGLDPLNTDYICFKPGQVPAGYNLAEGTPVESNGSVCFIQKGRKG